MHYFLYTNCAHDYKTRSLWNMPQKSQRHCNHKYLLWDVVSKGYLFFTTVVHANMAKKKKPNDFLKCIDLSKARAVHAMALWLHSHIILSLVHWIGHKSWLHITRSHNKQLHIIVSQKQKNLMEVYFQQWTQQ